jgi:cysteinyl-tRNA synthetase
MDMDLRGIDSAVKTHSRLRGIAEKCRRAAGVASKDYDDEFLQRFSDAMNDDFDTPLALRVLGEGVASAPNLRSTAAAARRLASVRVATRILGIDLGLG